MAVCLAHQSLPVELILLRYSVLFTAESLSLRFLLFISWFICSRKWCTDKLRVLLCKPNIHVSWSTSELRVTLAPWNCLSPPVNFFYWPLQGRISFVFIMFFLSCVCYAFVRVCLFVLLLWIFNGFFLCLVVAMPLWAYFYVCLVVTCWERL